MPDISTMPTQDLINIAKGGTSASSSNPDLSNYSNADLINIAKGHFNGNADCCDNSRPV